MFNFSSVKHFKHLIFLFIYRPNWASNKDTHFSRLHLILVYSCCYSCSLYESYEQRYKGDLMASGALWSRIIDKCNAFVSPPTQNHHQPSLIISLLALNPFCPCCSIINSRTRSRLCSLCYLRRSEAWVGAGRGYNGLGWGHIHKGC